MRDGLNWEGELKDAYENGQVVINPAYGRPLEATKEDGSKPGDVYNEYYNSFLIGEIEPTEENWQQFMEEYRAAGYDKIEKELNDKYYGK